MKKNSSLEKINNNPCVWMGINNSILFDLQKTSTTIFSPLGICNLVQKGKTFKRRNKARMLAFVRLRNFDQLVDNR